MSPLGFWCIWCVFPGIYHLLGSVCVLCLTHQLPASRNIKLRVQGSNYNLPSLLCSENTGSAHLDLDSAQSLGTQCLPCCALGALSLWEGRGLGIGEVAQALAFDLQDMETSKT